MEGSTELRDTMFRFYDRLSASDIAAFDDLVSSHQATLVIGTAPGEWITDRAQQRFGFETEGFRLEGDDPVAYVEDGLGWVADNPRFVMPDGSTVQARMTCVFRREDERWKLVHMHASVGVPDDEVVTLQQRWAGWPIRAHE